MKHKFLKSLISILDGALEILIRKHKNKLDMGNTLHIIGNGFDVMHGLPTSYKDFHNWIRQQPIKYVANEMEEVFQHSKCDFWSQFEASLGNLDLSKYTKDLVNEAHENQNPDDDPDKWANEADDVYARLEFIVSKNYQLLMEAFKEWAQTIEVANIERQDLSMMGYDERGLFLTFNYTDTIEIVYNVPQERVMHIHGRGSTHEEIIVGHSGDYNKQRQAICDVLRAKLYEDGDIEHKLIELFNQNRKSSAQVIANHSVYFNKLAKMNIEKIVVIGHSLGEVDIPYFERIIEVCPNAKWKFNPYSNDDKQRVSNFVNKYKLQMLP